MAVVAFPAGYKLERSVKMRRITGVKTDIMDDNTARQRDVSSSKKYTRIQCEYKYLTASEFNTLATFLDTNAANTITKTIDGFAYTGVVEDGWDYDMTGVTYNINFIYYASR